MSPSARDQGGQEPKGLSPLRNQYLRVKGRYPGCILFSASATSTRPSMTMLA